MPLSRRALALLAMLLALPLAAQAAPGAAPATSAASKKEIKKQCLDAHAEGQAARKRSALSAAKDAFDRCGNDACPTAVRSDCVTWYAEVDRAQPSIVVKALDATGVETTRVATDIDGKRMRDVLDGLPIVLDPGPHALRFEAADGAVVEMPLLLAEGERNKVITANFTRPLAPYRLTVPTIVLGSVSLVGLGLFVGFGVAGKNAQAELEDTCAPRCTQDAADAMRTKLIVADVGLATSLLAAGGALTFFFLQERGPAPVEKPGEARLEAGPGGVRVVGSF